MKGLSPAGITPPNIRTAPLGFLLEIVSRKEVLCPAGERRMGQDCLICCTVSQMYVWFLRKLDKTRCAGLSSLRIVFYMFITFTNSTECDTTTKISSRCVLCYYPPLTGLDVNLLQVHISHCKAICATQSGNVYYSLYFVAVVILHCPVL